MSLFGPIADTERRGWQRRALAVLGELLALDLPVMSWTLGAGASLVARPAAQDPAGQRRAFDAWTAHLDAHPWPERGGHMHAVVDRYNGLVHIAVVADITTEPDVGREP